MSIGPVVNTTHPTDGNRFAPVRRDLGHVDHDYVPGDPGDARRLAQRLRSFSNGLELDAAELMAVVRMARMGDRRWSGDLRDAFTDITPVLAFLLRSQFAPVLAQAGRSLDEYASEVEDLKSRAAAQLARGQAAEDRRVNLLTQRERHRRDVKSSPSPSGKEAAQTHLHQVEQAMAPPQAAVDDSLRRLEEIRKSRRRADGLLTQRLGTAAVAIREVTTRSEEITGPWAPEPSPVETGPTPPPGPPPGGDVDVEGPPVIGSPGPVDEVEVSGPGSTHVGEVRPGPSARQAPPGTFAPSPGTPTGLEALDATTDAGGVSGAAVAGVGAGLLGAGALGASALLRPDRDPADGTGGTGASATAGAASPRASRPGSPGGRRTEADAGGTAGSGDGAIDLGGVVPIVGAAAGAAVAMYVVGDRLLKASPGSSPAQSSSSFPARWLRLGREGLGRAVCRDLDAAAHRPGDRDTEVDDVGVATAPTAQELPGGLVADIPSRWRVVRSDGCVVIASPTRRSGPTSNIVVFADRSRTAALEAGIAELPSSIVIEAGTSPAPASGARIRFGYALGSAALTVHRHIVRGAGGLPVVATATTATGHLAEDAGPVDAILASLRPAC